MLAFIQYDRPIVKKNTKALSNDSLIIKQTLVNVDLPIEK